MAGTEVTVVEPEIEIVEDDAGTGVQPGHEVATTGTGYDYPEEEDEDRVGVTTGATGGAVVAGTAAETQEQLTARQRRRRAERAARERERNELTVVKNELAQLRQQIGGVDKRIATTEISATDQQIVTLEAEVQRANTVLGRAISAGNGEDASTALEIRDTLRDRLNSLKTVKKEQQQKVDPAVVSTQVAARQNLPPGISQAQVDNFNIFTTRHPWYDVQARNAESAQVKKIDFDLQQEGSDPNMASHWQELEKRIRESLPRFTKAANGGGDTTGTATRQASGPRLPGTGAGTNANGGNGAKKFHISAERKQALVDLGVWGTPDAQRYIKNFMKYDAAQAVKH